MIISELLTVLAVTKFVAGPSLIITVAFLIGMAIYQAATKGQDDKHTVDTINQMVRRCPQCGQVAGKSATTCRHCDAKLDSDSANLTQSDNH